MTPEKAAYRINKMIDGIVRVIDKDPGNRDVDLIVAACLNVAHSAVMTVSDPIRRKESIEAIRTCVDMMEAESAKDAGAQH